MPCFREWQKSNLKIRMKTTKMLNSTQSNSVHTAILCTQHYWRRLNSWLKLWQNCSNTAGRYSHKGMCRPMQWKRGPWDESATLWFLAKMAKSGCWRREGFFMWCRGGNLDSAGDSVLTLYSINSKCIKHLHVRPLTNPAGKQRKDLVTLAYQWLSEEDINRYRNHDICYGMHDIEKLLHRNQNTGQRDGQQN